MSPTLYKCSHNIYRYFSVPLIYSLTYATITTRMADKTFYIFAILVKKSIIISLFFSNLYDYMEIERHNP